MRLPLGLAVSRSMRMCMRIHRCSFCGENSAFPVMLFLFPFRFLPGCAAGVWPVTGVITVTPGWLSFSCISERGMGIFPPWVIGDPCESELGGVVGLVGRRVLVWWFG